MTTAAVVSPGIRSAVKLLRRRTCSVPVSMSNQISPFRAVVRMQTVEMYDALRARLDHSRLTNVTWPELPLRVEQGDFSCIERIIRCDNLESVTFHGLLQHRFRFTNLAGDTPCICDDTIVNFIPRC